MIKNQADTLPLKGVKVVELGAVPYAGGLFAQFGAGVLKVESCGAGDPLRKWRKLVKDAHIVIENFRPGTLEKWGTGWDALSQINPGLMMVI